MRKEDDVIYPTHLARVHGMQPTVESTGKMGTATTGRVRVPQMKTRGIDVNTAIV